MYTWHLQAQTLGNAKGYLIQPFKYLSPMTHTEDLSKRLHIVLQTNCFAVDLETEVDGAVENGDSRDCEYHSTPKLTELTYCLLGSFQK